MKEQNQTKSTNIKWHNLTIDREKLEKMRGHKGMVIWFTGLSGSGKSTLANALNEVLHLDGFSTYVLDGDNIRHGLCKDLGFSDEDREENIRRIGEVANLFMNAGIITITAFVSPFISDRDKVRKLLDLRILLKFIVLLISQFAKIGILKVFIRKLVWVKLRSLQGFLVHMKLLIIPKLLLIQVR